MHQASVASLSTLETNKVLKNTYLLLSATLGFSAVMAAVSMAMNVPPMAYLICVISSMVLGMFVLPRTANSASGLGVIFLVTGLLGFGLGPIISVYLSLANGEQVVGTALGGTAVIFLGLAGYAMTSKRDFSFMGGFVAIGMMVMVIGIVIIVAMLRTLMRLMLHIKTKNGIKSHPPPMYSNDRCRRRQVRLNRGAGRRNLRRIKLIRL